LQIISERKKGKGIVILFIHFQTAEITSPPGNIRCPIGNFYAGETQVFYQSGQGGNIRVGFKPKKRQFRKPKIPVNRVESAEFNGISARSQG
jgi:hypothetical protein